MWQVPGRAELLERLPGATPAGAEMTVTRLLAARSGVAARSRRTTGPPGPGRDWHAVGMSTGDHRDPVISAYLPGGEPEHAVRS